MLRQARDLILGLLFRPLRLQRGDLLGELSALALVLVHLLRVQVRAMLLMNDVPTAFQIALAARHLALELRKLLLHLSLVGFKISPRRFRGLRPLLSDRGCGPWR